MIKRAMIAGVLLLAPLTAATSASATGVHLPIKDCKVIARIPNGYKVELESSLIDGHRWYGKVAVRQYIKVYRCTLPAV